MIDSSANGGHDATLQTATLGGGCFWCTEAVFARLRGVHEVVSGYSGGWKEEPTYEQVCAETTGHAEVVQVSFDPNELSYADLLRVFFSSHDPTTLNRQGNDVGESYRSLVLFHSPEQQRVAREVVAEIDEAGWYRDRIVTQIAPFEKFWSAEEYHQRFFERNPSQGYCQFIVAPKVAKFRRQWSDRLQE